MTDELFQEVCESDIPKVMQVLKKDWPKHFVLYQILMVWEEFKKARTKLKHALYLYGDYETGIYLNKVSIEAPSGSTIYTYLHTYTPSSDIEPLRKALNQTKVIPWETQINFQMVQARFNEIISTVAKSKCEDCKILTMSLFWYPPEKQLEIKPLPDEVYMEFLDGSFADQMNKNWGYKFPGSDLLHKEQLDNNFGLGLFRKSDRRMVCSALINYTGAIGVLYSDPEFREKGYATAVIQHMVQELRVRDMIPFCSIKEGNSVSEKVFRKCGFEPLYEVNYVLSYILDV